MPAEPALPKPAGNARRVLNGDGRPHCWANQQWHPRGRAGERGTSSPFSKSPRPRVGGDPVVLHPVLDSRFRGNDDTRGYAKHELRGNDERTTSASALDVKHIWDVSPLMRMSRRLSFLDNAVQRFLTPEVQFPLDERRRGTEAVLQTIAGQQFRRVGVGEHHRQAVAVGDVRPARGSHR